MDTKLKSYSHSITVKIAAFIVVVSCFTGAVTALLNIAALDGDLGIISEKSYFVSRSYARDSEDLLIDLTRLLGEYKNEKHILDGGTITEEELRNGLINQYSEFQAGSRSYNPNLDEEENFKKFQEENADKVAEVRESLIKDDLREYHFLLQRLKGYKGRVYYASDGTNVFTNSTGTEKAYFKTYPSYMLFDKYERELYPTEIQDNKYRITEIVNQLDPQNSVVYIAFTEQFLNSKINEWKEDKLITTTNLYRLAGFLLGLIPSFLYLILVTGRKSFKDQEVHLNTVDRLYIDINLGLCIGFIVLWAVLLQALDFRTNPRIVIPITLPIASAGLILVLSQVRHFKNKTLVKHTLIYSILRKMFNFAGEVYSSGSVGVKTMIIVIGYPVAVVLSLYLFPVTIGAAAWFAFKKVKAFNTIKEGVGKIKAGDINHIIDVEGKGEFGSLAADINSIADGLKKAVDNELKSERLKTELITNVSHDIRTPLTSIITYVDLLKKEKDPSKTAEYIEVLDQKSQRLKVLTDDLFEAAKASSGNVPVSLERINIVSLITQGLGELNDKIEAVDLEFKLGHPRDQVYVLADGKLLWRAIENLLSNIFKYALRGSRVYIDIADSGSEVLLTIKNISAYELNISAEELMERFKRGDESRSSQGSGLGLSIAKSLIDIQGGKFSIEVDGDLFKAKIYMPKDKD